MSEEEKEAIDYLKNNCLCRTDKNGNIIATGNAYVVVILNLIEKQQKEIEELKNTETYKIAIIDKDKYVNKDKIKEKIEELEKTRKMLTDSNGMVEISASIDILKELLEGDK